MAEILRSSNASHPRCDSRSCWGRVEGQPLHGCPLWLAPSILEGVVMGDSRFSSRRAVRPSSTGRLAGTLANHAVDVESARARSFGVHDYGDRLTHSGATAKGRVSTAADGEERRDRAGARLMMPDHGNGQKRESRAFERAGIRPPERVGHHQPCSDSGRGAGRRQFNGEQSGPASTAITMSPKGGSAA